MKTFILRMLLLPGIFSQSSLAAQLPVEKVEALCQAYYDAGGFNGVILIAHGKEIIFNKAYGLADRELKVPLQTGMKFKIGSLSKPFTAVLILQLVDEGILRLDDHITDHIPEYSGEGGNRITIEQLLNHTSGIIQSLDPETEAEEEKMYHNLSEMAFMADTAALYFEPGTGFHYSNFGYQILAYIAERACNAPFDELLKERVFEPAGMSDTRQHDALKIEPGLVRGYEYKLLGGFENASYIDPSYAAGAGGLISTDEDLQKFNWALYQGTLLSEEMYRSMIRPSIYGSYGSGWELQQETFSGINDTVRFISHTGSINGYGAYMGRAERDSLFVVVLKNFRSDTYIAPSYAPRIGGEIFSILYGETVDLPRKSVAQEIGLILGLEGMEKAVEEYHRLRDADSLNFNFDESELNLLGIELLFRFNMPEDALKIFELNMKEYPFSYNTYDSYAYVLKVLGDYPNAIRYYRLGLDVLERYPEYNQGESVQKDARNAIKSIDEMEKQSISSDGCSD
ncbi:MAG: serine hydrolase [Bacteroidales bacterium]